MKIGWTISNKTIKRSLSGSERLCGLVYSSMFYDADSLREAAEVLDVETWLKIISSEGLWLTINTFVNPIVKEILAQVDTSKKLGTLANIIIDLYILYTGFFKLIFLILSFSYVLLTCRNNDIIFLIQIRQMSEWNLFKKEKGMKVNSSTNFFVSFSSIFRDVLIISR